MEPTICYLLTPIDLDFPRNVWICLSEKHNNATIELYTIEFLYKSYRTCDDINNVRLASHNISFPQQKKDIIVKNTQILEQKT